LFEKRLTLFQKNPHDPALDTHPLKYEWEGYSSFRLTSDEGADDFRVIFEKVRGGYRFVDFGTHDQLYRPWR
jgi:mRNA-degrading endonuclease YafQ of YafQ-DinJ toxin-antitoxin module